MENKKQEGLAVASIARDDPSPLPARRIVGCVRIRRHAVPHRAVPCRILCERKTFTHPYVIFSRLDRIGARSGYRIGRRKLGRRD